jgi:hypothetical protein
MALAYMQVFADMEELLEPFADDERGRLLTAMMRYAFRGEETKLEGNERYIWPVLRRTIDQSAESLDKKKANGKKGGRPATESKPEETEVKPEETGSKPNKTENNHEQEQEQEQEHEQEHEQEQEQEQEHVKDAHARKRARAGFAAPTPDEAAAYFREKGGTDEQAQRFCDFYASKGWKVGKEPMRDWQAAARGWISRDKAGGSGYRPPPQKTDAMQRYTPEQYRATYGEAILDFDG